MGLGAFDLAVLGASEVAEEEAPFGLYYEVEAFALVRLQKDFRWKDLLESGKFPTVKALAEAVGLERSYVGKLLNLTLLSPKTIEALVAGDEPEGLTARVERAAICHDAAEFPSPPTIPHVTETRA